MMKNNTKRIIMSACAALSVAAGIHAQEQSVNYRKTPFYIMPQVSINYTDNENSHFQDWYKMLAPGASITIGKEFSSLWGWRYTIGYKRNRETSNWRDMNRDYSFLTFEDVETFLDLTFDYSDLVFRNNKRRPWKVMLFAGIGGAKSFGFGDDPLSSTHSYNNKPSAVLGMRGGVNVSYLLSDRVALALEGTGYWFQDRFNGVDESRHFDAKSELGLGVVFYLGKRKALNNSVPMIDIVPAAPAVEKHVITPVLAFITPQVVAKSRSLPSKDLNLSFPVNKTILYPDFMNNKSELADVRSSIDLVNKNNEYLIRNISLHGYASPEGSYGNNTRLAKGRVEALRDWIMKEYGFKSDLFTINYTPEDWEGLRRYVASSDMSEKQEILNIIDNNSLEPDYKEHTLKVCNGGAPFKFLLKNVFTTLRHTTYVINYEVRPFNLEEAKQRVFTHPDLLNLNEMFQVAMSYGKGTDEYTKVCLIAADTYPESSEANINAACAMLEAKNIDKAKEYLNKVSACPQKTHALGVIEALNGNYDAARRLLQQSADAGLAESAEMLKQLQK